MNKLLLSLLLFLPLNTILGQKKIDKELLIKDLDVLKANLEAYHTGLYTYTTKAAFEQWYSETKVNLSDASSLEFYKKLSELNTFIKNGHTWFHINPEQIGTDGLMPSFKIYKDNEKFYIKEATNQEIIGKEIVSIDEVAIGEVFDQLLRYKERDGNNRTQPTEELIYNFGRTYALHYGSRPQTQLVILEGTTRKEITLKNIPFGKFSHKTDELFDHGGLEFSIENSIATLKVETFNLYPLKKAKYSSKLKRLFKEIKKQNINHLIIDIRNNGGGHTASVEELISYIYGEEFIFYDDVYRSHKDWDPSIIPEISQYQKNISSWAFKKGDDGYYRAITGSDGMKRKKPKKNYFQGELYILTNGSTLSAAAEFSSFVKQYRKATFIGDETGGNKVQNTSGDWLVIGLPNSKVYAFIPYALWKMNVRFKNDGHGIKPDHFVQNSIEQELNNEDRVVTFTYEMIKRSMANNGYK
ncbi:S41 family peptidase [Sungkyunkwania multivorans]|uniref:S41 family peptidase n=1 Tax=Sungkyunkwania multivorans TaxID=1173618 RepID=A0ABW3D0P1_9FLAO